MMAMRRDHELHGRRRGRNVAVFAALIGLVALLFAVTLVKLGEDAANPTGGASWGESLVRWLTNDPVEEGAAAPQDVTPKTSPAAAGGQPGEAQQ